MDGAVKSSGKMTWTRTARQLIQFVPEKSSCKELGKAKKEQHQKR